MAGGGVQAESGVWSGVSHGGKQAMRLHALICDAIHEKKLDTRKKGKVRSMYLHLGLISIY